MSFASSRTTTSRTGDGVNLKRSLFTDDKREANTAKHRVDEMLKDIRLGRVAPPDDVDPVDWIISGGRADKKQLTYLTFSQLCEKYSASIPAGAKSKNTLQTETTHIKHLQRILGAKRHVGSIKTADIQEYVAARSRDGKSPDTISKELGTLGQIWNYAKSIDAVRHDLDRKQIKLPKRQQKPRFHTIAEVRKAEQSGISGEDLELLWDSVFLNEQEVKELLEHVKEAAQQRWIYPAVATAAYTGARRSEICRAEVRDVDLESGRLDIREKKRVRNPELSFRSVPIHPNLQSTLENWLAQHPGSRWLFCQDDGAQLSVGKAAYHWEQTMAGSAWEKLKGWHTQIVKELLVMSTDFVGAARQVL